MPRGGTASRWVLASVVAMLVAAWPAYRMYTSPDHEGDGAEYANLDFTLKDMHGNDVRLADYAGRPVIVNFWATWCTPCKHEIPIFIDLVEQYKDEGFTVLGISTDDTAEDLVPFAEEFGINYPVLVGFGRDDLLDAYQAGFFVPTSWFIRRDGSVALKWPGTSTPEWFEEQVKLLVDDRPLASDGTR